MSLRVWLPLTKDLRNQGLDDVTVTNNGATFDANGKLGGCYYFNNAYAWLPMDYSTFGTEFSVAFWYKIDTAFSGNRHLVCLCNQYGWPQLKFTCAATSNSTLAFNIGDGSTSARSLSTSQIIGSWQHICFTFNNKIAKVYVNGVQTGTATYPINPDWSGTTKMGIGGAPDGHECAITLSLNDVRIYDHALSPMEVKQISQGLVLHYPLSDNSIQSLDNCYVYPRFETSSSSGGWSHWGGSGHAGTYGQTTDTNYIFRKGQTYAHWVADGSSATKNYLLYQSPAFNGGLRSLITICKEENSKPITNDICYAAWNARNGGVENNSWTSIQSLGNGFYLCKCEGISQSGSDDLVGIYIKPGYKVYFSEVYLENYKSVCSDIFFPSTVIYDTSGYGNNGTLMTDTIITSTDTAKYQISTHFNGTYDGILIENLQLSNIINTAITYAFWIKPEGESGARSVYFGSYSSTSWSIEKTTNNVLRLFWNGSPDETCSGVTIIDGVWQHICITKNGTNDVKVYINGVQKWSSTTTHNNLSFPTIYRLGRDTRSNDGTPYKGLMSDFRIYATALSADDIKSLYQNSAYIDNQGNIYGAVYKEV